MGRAQPGLPGAGILARYLRVLSRRKEDDALLEADPVGDFLARKKAGFVEPVAEGAKPDLPPVLVGLDSDSSDEDRGRAPQDVTTKSEEAAAQGMPVGSSDEDMPSPVLEATIPDEEAGEEGVVQNESEGLVQTEERSESTVEKGENDESIKRLLEVFKNERLSENPISTLSKDLSDTDVYALLQETKEVAQKFRRTANLHQISCDFIPTDEDD
ncbi:MAG: hypothetical protein IBX68_07980 [Dehalococcoidia bacterium]|nr:hypothetical protein [Dehalococcoidia bacterium]